MSSDGPTVDVPMTRRVFAPISVLVAVYLAYFAFTYSKVYTYVYWELMNLGTRIIGYAPSGHTLALYGWGVLVLVFGFFLGDALAGWKERRPDAAQSLSRLVEALGRLRPFSGKDWTFWLSLAGWAVGFGANLVQVRAGGLSLFDIASRWAQSPVLVWFAASQIFFVPAVIIFAKGPWRRALGGVLFFASAFALALLGARNLPAKLVVSTFLALVYVLRPKNIWRMAVAFALLLALTMGVVGAISKSGIYGPAASVRLAVALAYSDSVGTAYNLDRIVRLTPANGSFEGDLLKDSSLALIPGVSAEYANYQIGRYLGGRKGFVIGGEVIERSVSLSPTLIGTPYADWGVLGVAGQMTLLGAVFGYLGRRGRRAIWLLPFLVTMASYVINGVNAGIHNPHAIVSVTVALVVMALDMLFGRALEVLPAMGSEELVGA